MQTTQLQASVSLKAIQVLQLCGSQRAKALSTPPVYTLPHIIQPILVQGEMTSPTCYTIIGDQLIATSISFVCTLPEKIIKKFCSPGELFGREIFVFLPKMRPQVVRLHICYIDMNGCQSLGPYVCCTSQQALTDSMCT